MYNRMRLPPAISKPENHDETSLLGLFHRFLPCRHVGWMFILK